MSEIADAIDGLRLMLSINLIIISVILIIIGTKPRQ